MGTPDRCITLNTTYPVSRHVRNTRQMHNFKYNIPVSRSNHGQKLLIFSCSVCRVTMGTAWLVTMVTRYLSCYHGNSLVGNHGNTLFVVLVSVASSLLVMYGRIFKPSIIFYQLC